MNALSNLNPDFFKTIVESGGRRQLVVYSTMDDFAISSVNTSIPNTLIPDPKLDLVVYADTVYLFGELKLPGRNISIHARKIILGSDVVLNTSPLAAVNADPNISTNRRIFNQAQAEPHHTAADIPADDTFYVHGSISNPASTFVYGEFINRGLSFYFKGAKGKNGADGAHAGTISLASQEIEAQNHSFKLITKGGQGAVGQGGMDGPTPGIGADGKGWIPVTPVPRELGDGKGEFTIRTHFQDIYVPWAKRGGDGGIGGNAGAGGAGGNGGNITIVAPKKAAISTDASGGNHGADGQVGHKTDPMPPGLLRVYYASNRETPVLTLATQAAAPGKDGAPVNRATNPGVGAQGKVEHHDAEQVIMSDYYDSVFLLKLLQKAKNYYLYQPPYSLPEEERKNSKTFQILNWLVNTLYKQMPIQGQPSAEDLRKKEIFHEATALFRNYTNGAKSLFGKAENWVPRLSVEKYKADLQQMVKPFQTIEQKFEQLMKESETKKLTDMDRQDLRATLETKIGMLDVKLKKLNDYIPNVLDTIENYDQSLSILKRNIDETISYRYKRELDTFHCDIASILKALEMIAFDPKNLAMAFVQGANLLYKGMTEIDGVNKDYLFGQIDSIDKLIQNDPSQTMEKVLGDKLANPPKDGNYLLIAKLDEFEEKMQKVNKELSDHGVILQNEIAQLKSLVETRSNSMLEYNSILGMVLKYQAQKESLQAKLNDLKTDISRSSDPTMVGTISTLAVIYQNMRDQVLELLYRADQALKFWKVDLDGNDTIFDQFRKNVLWVNGAFPSQFKSDELISAISNLEAEIREALEKWGQAALKEPSRENVIGDIKIVIDDPEDLEQLFGGKKISFSIRSLPDDGEEDNEYMVDDVEGKYDIRVNYVRPRLILKNPNENPGSDKVEFKIHHSGTSEIWNKRKKVTFKHDALSSSFTQILHPTGSIDYGSGVAGVFKTDDDLFAPIGLFSLWTFTIDPDIRINENLKIIPNRLQALEIEFGCSFHLHNTAE